MYALRTIADTQDHSEAEKVLRRVFTASLDQFTSQITGVIVEAMDTLASLDRLEDHLYSVHSLWVPEAVATDVELRDLLWEIWTILGGNQERLRDLRQRTTVLREVEQYRTVALAYVTGAAQTLGGLEAELFELKNTLNRIIIEDHDIPLEVHLASIERSIHRMESVTAPGTDRSSYSHVMESISE